MGLTIAVCIKPVPVTTRLDPHTGRLDRSVAHRMNSVDENAVEAALTLRESVPDSEVVAVSVAPAEFSESLRPALAMGADRAINVSAPELEGADLLGVSAALATALSGIHPDLVVFGAWSSDGYGAMLWAAVGERLGFAVASRAVDFMLEADRLTVTRQIEEGTQVVEVVLPAVLALSGEVNTPRYPSFKDVIAGKRKPIENLTMTECPVTAGTTVLSIDPAPLRTRGIVIQDDGRAHEQLIDFLALRGIV
ncbi:MAG: electron transfer flavoprotein subunit beta/FixA family protein [Actinobacteria bacterium]|nr:electron transfer flavoprotein subunit beta/FixA family protein [Actinomycetota bacterium]